MSVYTSLSLDEVQAFAKPYGLKVLELVPIQGGIQNTNYFMVCEDQQYVLTVFEEMNQEQAGELVPVLDHLSAHDVPVAVPLKHSGQAIHFIANKPAQIAPRVLGSHPESTSIKQVQAIAKAQAQLHVALQDFPLQRHYNRNHSYWKQVAHDLKLKMDQDDAELLEQVLTLFQNKKNQYPDRPTGFIHSDLFRDNTLFNGDQLQGILDFYELNKDEFLFDIAITTNDFCTDYPDVSLNMDKAKAYLDAYQSIRQLTSDELACVDIYLAIAACRFWLMRLGIAIKNCEQGRTGDDILQKNPMEMRNMLEERLKYVKN